MAVTKRRTKQGRTRYAAKWRDPDGTYRERWFDTKAEARAYDEARKLGTTLDPTSHTLNDLATLWRNDHLATKPKHTQVFYERHLAKRILPNLGSRKLNALSPMAIQQWRNGIASAASRTTANQALRTLKALLEKGVEWGIISTNPSRSVKPFPVEARLPRVYTNEEVDKLIGACVTHRDAALLTLLAGSGLRIGEACALTWENISDRWIQVHRSFDADGSLTPVKNYRERRVPMLKAAADVLQEWRSVGEHDVWVFPCPDGSGPVRPDTFQKSWQRIRVRAGVSGRLHDFRHTYASNLITKGLDVKQVQSAMGHGSPVTTLRIYAHLTRDEDAVLAVLDS